MEHDLQLRGSYESAPPCNKHCHYLTGAEGHVLLGQILLSLLLFIKYKLRLYICFDTHTHGLRHICNEVATRVTHCNALQRTATHLYSHCNTLHTIWNEIHRGLVLHTTSFVTQVMPCVVTCCKACCRCDECMCIDVS